MFSKVKLRNYKSLVNLDVDFLLKKNTPKPIVIIYGENGAGKTNLISAFTTLSYSLQTMMTPYQIDRIFTQNKIDLDENNDLDEQEQYESFKKFLLAKFPSTKNIIEQNKTIGSIEPMVLEYEFYINNKRGVYHIEYDDMEIIEEKLMYTPSNRISTLFEVTKNHTKISTKAFKHANYRREINYQVKQYFGKHSLLSIIVNEIISKSRKFIKDNICDDLIEIVDEFVDLSIKEENELINIFDYENEESPFELTEGVIPISQSAYLDEREEILNNFFTSTYSDIQEVYYKKEIKNEKIRYQLFIKKKIYGRILDIDFRNESSGTRNLLKIIIPLLKAVSGQTVIIDELDTGIHDVLIKNIIDSIIGLVKGQLIITTHNTLLFNLNSGLSSLYVFNIDNNANKELISIDEYEDRDHPNLNYQNRYLKGLYGGVPITGNIDFEELGNMYIDEIASIKKTENEHVQRSK